MSAEQRDRAICRTCGAREGFEAPAWDGDNWTRVIHEMPVPRTPERLLQAAEMTWLCPACSSRLPVALDYIAESRGGGDPHAEYVERLESALMAGWFQLLMDRCGWHTGGWIGQDGFLPFMTPGQFVESVDAFRRRTMNAPTEPISHWAEYLAPESDE